MPGTKGKSGGRRQGAGAKRSKDNLLTGHPFAAVRHYPDGRFEMLPIATIETLSANLIVITLSDGGSIRLAR
jgi:hypothetical protein